MKHIVEDASGKRHVVEAPDDWTPEQVMQAAGSIIPQETAPTLDQKLQASIPARIYKGMKDPVDAGAQLLPRGLEWVTSVANQYPNALSKWLGSEAKRVDEMTFKDEAQYQASRKATGQDGFDFARLSGNVLSPVNLAPVSLISKPAMTIASLAGAGMKAGAMGGALTPVTDPSEPFAKTKLYQVGSGTVMGGILSPLFGKVAQAIAPRIERLLSDPTVVGARASLETDAAIPAALKEVGTTPDELGPTALQKIRQEVLNAFKQNKRLDPASVLRQKDFSSLGMAGPENAPLLGQLTREPGQFAREKNLRAVPGIGDPLLTRFYNQNRTLADKFDSLGANKAQEGFQAGKAAIESLDDADKILKGQVTAAYTAARESSGKNADVPLSGLAQDYADVLGRFGDKVPSGVRGNFEKLGLLSGKQKTMFSVEDADKLLKVINDNVSNDPATNKALGELRNAVKNAVLSGGDDVFASARKLAADRFSLMDVAPALRAVANGKATADDFVKKFVINGKVDDLKAAAKYLDVGTFDQMRSQLAAHLKRAAFGENVAADGAFSGPERYAQTLRNIGTDKLRIFFNEAEIEQFKVLGRVGAYINRAPAAAPVLGNPNMVWAGPMMGMIDRLPTIGTLARIGSGLAKSGRQSAEVNAALAAKLQPTPYVPPNLEPLLPYFGPAAAYGGGLLGGAGLR